VPVVYFSLGNEELYKIVRPELILNYNNFKKDYNLIIKNKSIETSKESCNSINLIEKTQEYLNYKSSLIRIILLDHTHTNYNDSGKILLDKIMNKWINNTSISQKIRDIIYKRTINNIMKNEKEINNLEEILMLISLQILENYYN